MFHQRLLSPLVIEAKSEESSQQKVFYKTGVRLGRGAELEGGRSEDLKLAYLPTCLTYLLLRQAPREHLLESGAGITG